METKCGIQTLHGKCMYVPGLNALKQQSTKAALVEFINFSAFLNSIACKLVLPTFHKIPVIEGATPNLIKRALN